MTDKDKHTISLNHKQRRYLDARRKREAKKHKGGAPDFSVDEP